MKSFAILFAFVASAAAIAIAPRSAALRPSNDSITILQPTYLQNIGAPGDTFSVLLSQEDLVNGFESTELSVVLGINPCGDDDVCGDNPAGFFGDVLYNGNLDGSDMLIYAKVPEGFLDGRASLNLFHAALQQPPNDPLQVFTEVKQITVIVSPAT
ncbi:unnamed protein product [Peniophora sp. CBMAI 1063]|nr:unnamed protein product [Peniophora sp. CBMAI 1063]